MEKGTNDTKEFKQTRLIIVLIAIIVILVFALGFILGTKNSNTEKTFNSNKTEEEEHESTIEPKSDEKPMENNQKELAYGVLESNGKRDTVNITLNGKNNTLLLENNKKENGVIKFGNTNIDLMVKFGAGPNIVYDTTHKLNYNVVIGEDNKEYLVVSYGESLQQYLLILNDNANIIGQYSTHYTNTKFYSEDDDCFVYNDNDEILYKVSGNEVFFYKYKEGSFSKNSNDQGYVILEEVLIKINNNKVSENTTGNTINSHVGQCS